jgi:hypothetical protein
MYTLVLGVKVNKNIDPIDMNYIVTILFYVRLG